MSRVVDIIPYYAVLSVKLEYAFVLGEFKWFDTYRLLTRLTSKIHVNVSEHSYSIQMVFTPQSNCDMIFCYGNSLCFMHSFVQVWNVYRVQFGNERRNRWVENKGI